jgi:hypothetical protein
MKIAQDKWKHFFVGIAMGIATGFVVVFISGSNYFGNGYCPHPGNNHQLMALNCFQNYIAKGHFDFNDAVAGTIGGILGMVIILVIKLQ